MSIPQTVMEQKIDLPQFAENDRRQFTLCASAPQFVTVLPDGREVSLDDPESCREIALRVEMLARGIVPAAVTERRTANGTARI